MGVRIPPGTHSFHAAFPVSLVPLKTFWTAIALIAAVAVAFSWLSWKSDRDPRINFLPGDSRAEWIVFPAAIDARTHRVATVDATFRQTFALDSQPGSARLLVRAAKRIELKINGEAVPSAPPRNWKQISTLDVSKFLRSGPNAIEARVFNDDAPPALWLTLTADSSTLRTDQRWEVSLAGSSWRAGARAITPKHPGPGNFLAGGERISDALPKILARWIIFGIVAVLLALAVVQWLDRRATTPNDARSEFSRREVFALLGVCSLAWAILFWNNAKMLPFPCGYDFNDHIAYIKYIQDHRALPLPNEGFEMFQPPLYYALSAGVLSICRLAATDGAAVIVLRAMTVIFGIANFVFVFLSIRLLFPGRTVAQAMGLLLAAFLPMQLYLSHYVTNETLAATLATAAIYFALRVLTANRVSNWQGLALGVCVGAAMLAKATSLLLIPALFGALAINLLQSRAPIFSWFRTFGATSAAILITCGWHYIRIWQHFGKPIVGNWDAALGFPWWQDPGFHTAGDYFRFGQSLVAPLFSGFNGFADGIYSTLWGDSLGGGLSGVLSRTPWNYHLMFCGYWLATIPTLLVVLGIVISILRFVRRITAEWFLLLGFSTAIFGALIFMTLKVASYAQVKAFYGLAAAVPLCAFAVAGWQILATRSRLLRLIATTLLIFFAINSFASVWIRPTSEQHIYNALRLITQSRPAAVVSEATAALRSDPSNAAAAYVLAAVLDETGDSNKAVAECDRCLQLDPNNGNCHFQLAINLAKQNNMSRAMTEARRAVELQPENPRAYDVALTLARELHRAEEALAIGRDALVVSPYDSDLHYRVGLAAGEVGDLTTATQQLAYAVLLNPTRPDYEQKLRVALSFLAQRPDAGNTIRVLQPLAAGSPKLLEILAAYRQDPSSTQ